MKEWFKERNPAAITDAVKESTIQGRRARKRMDEEQKSTTGDDQGLMKYYLPARRLAQEKLRGKSNS